MDAFKGIGVRRFAPTRAAARDAAASAGRDAGAPLFYARIETRDEAPWLE
jgi:hypothetical protein